MHVAQYTAFAFLISILRLPPERGAGVAAAVATAASTAAAWHFRFRSSRRSREARVRAILIWRAYGIGNFAT